MQEPIWLNNFQDAKPVSNGWACRCSAHEDNHQSLSIFEGDDGTARLHCHAGCDIRSILKGAGMKMADLVGEKQKVEQIKSRIIATYDYCDEVGKLLYQAVRFAPKDFRQRQPDGKGGWLWSLKGARLIPYRLEEVIASDTVYIVEGEKDVETLRKHGKVATCNPMGAGKWRNEFSGYLSGKTVIILPDNDKPGREHAGKVYKSLEKTAKSVEIVDIPTGKDITEYLEAGGKFDDLQKPAAIIPTTDLRAQYNPNKDTHMGNAERLIQVSTGDLKYCKASGWLVWTGKVWAQDEDRVSEIYKTRVIPAIYSEAAQAAAKYDPLATKALATWAKRSESASIMTATLEMASTSPEIKIAGEELDQHSMLLNVVNGTIDLTTGKHRAHNRNDLMTRQSKVTYSQAAKCPRWLQFLAEIFPQGQVMVDWIQRAAGYCLTASVAEQVMFFATGCGKNGKSVFINTLMDVMGSYACETPTDTLMAKHNGQGGIANDLARLPGVRFVSANETEQGQRLAEAKIKGMTGGDTISARFLHKEFFDFKPVFKLWLRSNHKPVVKGTDEGIWRRIRLIPFVVNFEGKEDRKLPEKLQSELPGILNWAIEGCLQWQLNGLDMPETICNATQQYRSSQDTIGLFLSEKTVSGTEFQSYNIKATDLYRLYVEWCDEAGERAQSQRKLAEALLERGFNRFLGGAEWSYRWTGLTVRGAENARY